MLDYIKGLNFIEVELMDKGPLLSQMGFCHRNCEEYVRLNPQTKHLLGWIVKNYSNGNKDFLLHSCIMENYVVKDITPWLMGTMRGEFAPDPKLSINPNNVFSFISEDFGELLENQHIVQDR